MPLGTLAAIQRDHPDNQRSLTEVLKGWLNSHPDPSWEGLVRALRCPLVGAEMLANKLETNFCSEQKVDGPEEEECARLMPVWNFISITQYLSC